MNVLLAHPGTQYSFHLANQLYKHKLLYEFHTSIAFGKGSWQYRLIKWLPPGMKHKICNRLIEDVPDKLLRRNIKIEIKALWDIKRGKDAEWTFYTRNKKFQENISDADIISADVVIGFDTSSWLLAERCKKMGKKFILDVSIGHLLSKKKYFEKIQFDYSGWDNQLIPKTDEISIPELSESDLATDIVVPSNFVKETYIENGIAPGKLTVNPFGTNVNEFLPVDNKPIDKLLFFFLGGLTARKGLPLLLDAWQLCDTRQAELIIAGFGQLPTNYNLPDRVTNLGKLVKSERNKVFAQSHVFLFPSYFEGLAQVQIEAMASGLPLVGTPNSGAFELVDEGINGFVIEAGNVEALKEKISYFLLNRNKISGMGKMARKKAEEFTWDAYGQRWKRILSNS